MNVAGKNAIVMIVTVFIAELSLCAALPSAAKTLLSRCTIRLYVCELVSDKQAWKHRHGCTNEISLLSLPLLEFDRDNKAWNI